MAIPYIVIASLNSAMLGLVGACHDLFSLNLDSAMDLIQIMCCGKTV